MILVGIDDTDMLDSPGTNQLARHLVAQLADRWNGRRITRHQLLDDPRVPCTRRNGCVALALEPRDGAPIDGLIDAICSLMLPWCPPGSDPGLVVVTGDVPGDIVEFGRLCQRDLVTQAHARRLAELHGIFIRGLGGSEDGVIGALAAVGLAHTQDDGRVIYVGDSEVDHYYVSGVHRIEELARFGVDQVRRLDDPIAVGAGRVDLGKRLRPNLRGGKVVLFVTPSEQRGVDWLAERVL